MLTLNRYNAFKVFTLYSLGYIKQAVELGFEVYDTRSRNPGYASTHVTKLTERIMIFTLSDIVTTASPCSSTLSL
jgi:hypothetical protein